MPIPCGLASTDYSTNSRACDFSPSPARRACCWPRYSWLWHGRRGRLQRRVAPGAKLYRSGGGRGPQHPRRQRPRREGGPEIAGHTARTPTWRFAPGCYCATTFPNATGPPRKPKSPRPGPCCPRRRVGGWKPGVLGCEGTILETASDNCPRAQVVRASGCRRDPRTGHRDAGGGAVLARLFAGPAGPLRHRALPT